MHSAPSVTYPVGRPLFPALLAAGLWAAGAATTVFWTYQADAPGWRQAAAGLGLMVSGGWALSSWLRSAKGQLQWDGIGWTGPHGTDCGIPAVALDLQELLLLRWQAPRSRRWLWLERRRCPQRWMDVRRAVYSRARPQPLPPAAPPAATQ